MPGVFQDTPNKRIVRENWNTPILRYLNSQYRFRFRYFGLPGVEALDITLWQDMIDEVVAFEVESRGRDPRRGILELRRRLRLIGKPATAYFGPFEDVVLQRKDWEGTPYDPTGVITLYNLDFCNEIGSTVYTKEHGERRWRFAAIRQVLMDQRECFRKYGGSNLFVLLMTIRDQIHATALNDHLGAGLRADAEAYVSRCAAEQPLPHGVPILGTHTWALKALVHNVLREYMAAPNISVLFFPLLRYLGKPVNTRSGSLDSPMLHWMMLCKFGNPEAIAPRFMPDSYLERVSSVSVDGNRGIIGLNQLGESGEPAVTNPVDWLRLHARTLGL